MKFFKQVENTMGKGEMLITSNFSFSHSVFKRHVFQTRKNQVLFGKGLSFHDSKFFLEGGATIREGALIGGNTLITTLLSQICTNLCPNISVDFVSDSLYEAGEQQMIIVVLAFPPKLSCKIRVSLLSLYGTWLFCKKN